MDRTAWARAAFAIALATSWSFACTTNEPGQPACVPGRSLDCTCIDGRPGAQACSDDGTAYGACVCGSNTDAGPSNDATVADANAGDVAPTDDAPSDDGTARDGANGDAGAIDAGDVGTPTVACSFTIANPYNEEVYRVASGPSGRIAAVGYFGVTVDAGPIDFGDGTKITIPDGSMLGGFVFTLDTSCKVVWARAIDPGEAIAFDSKGNIWAVSARNGSAAVSALTKLDPLGNVLFQTAFGSPSGPPFATVGITQIAVDAADAVVVVGEYAGTPSLGGNPLSDNNTGTFVAKLSSSGAHMWSKGFGGAKSCPRTPDALALDPSGDVLIVGSFGNVGCDISFGGPQFTATGTDWAYAARLSGADGSHIWSQALQGGSFTAACVTGSGSIDVAGTLTMPHDFGSGVVPAGPFAARLAPDGGGVLGGTVPFDYAGQMVCGGSLGERAVVAALVGQAPSLQLVESDGGAGWSFLPPAGQGYTTVASGANRDILFGGYVRPGTSDVYVLRLTR